MAPLYVCSCCYSITKSHLTLCDPMDWSTPGLPVPHCLPDFAQVYVHWIAIQPSHPLLLSSSAFDLSQHQGLFQWIGSLHQVAKILELQFSRSVMSDSLRPHELQHARPPCPSPTPGVHPNPCLLCRWCHPTISSSAVPFSSHLQSFPASGSFQMSQPSASGGQSIGVSASTSVLPMITQDQSPLEWTGWICLQSKELSRGSPTPQFSISPSNEDSGLVSCRIYWFDLLAVQRTLKFSLAPQL